METKSQPKGIMIMKSYYDAINDLELEDQMIMFKAIMEFGFNGTDPIFDKKYLNGYWKLIEPTLSRGIANYASKVANGKKGAEAKHKKEPSTPIIETKNEIVKENQHTPNQIKLIKLIKSKDLNEFDEKRFIGYVESESLTTPEELTHEFSQMF